MLSIVPELFGLPRAQLTHLECVGDGADACVYELRWREHVSAGAAGAGGGRRQRGRARRQRAAAARGAARCGGASRSPAPGVLFRLEIRRRQRGWRQLQREAEDNADVAQRLFASLQDLVSDLQLDEVLRKVTRNAQAAVGGREFALLHPRRRRLRLPELLRAAAGRHGGAGGVGETATGACPSSAW